MKRYLLTALIGLALCATAFAADDNPLPTTSSTLLTQNIPDGFEVTILVTPVTKVDGLNVADVTKIYVEAFSAVRTLNNGVQVGDLKRTSLGKRDCTAWFMARTNVTTGLPVALAISDDRASWALQAWRLSPPPTE